MEDSHTDNNEWVEMLNTPLKRSAKKNFQTPVKLLEVEPELKIKTVKISNWDIFWTILNTIIGKDKLAKVSQYSLRLLMYHAKSVESAMLLQEIDLSIINLPSKDILQSLFSQPMIFIKSLITLLCILVRTNVSGLVNGLGIYRQFLRFGKSPFKIRDLGKKIQNAFNFETFGLNKSIFSRSTLMDIATFWYALHDELGLLYKLKFYTNTKLVAYANKNDAIGWYSETILTLLDNWDTLSSLSQQEMDMKIQIQVTKKAKLLSKQILGNNSASSSAFNTSIIKEISADDLKYLNDLQFKKNNAWLDVYKNLSDFVFNTYTVFDLVLPFDTIQIWMGISASTLSLLKIYRETKKNLIEQELSKRR